MDQVSKDRFDVIAKELLDLKKNDERQWRAVKGLLKSIQSQQEALKAQQSTMDIFIEDYKERKGL